MTVNYEAIRLANIEEYGKGTRHLAYLSDLYSTRTHFISELLQNTEDALARAGEQNQKGFAEFRLYSDRLELRHNGKPFDEEDIRGICGIGEGTKAGDFSQIGKFGVGFKAVYSYTLAPQIHSGQEHFRIRRFVEPHHMDVDSGHAELSSNNETLIVLPFDSEELSGYRERLPPEVAVAEIGKALNDLHPRSLLFLQHIREVRWVLPGGECGSIRRRSRSISDNPAARVVNLFFGQHRERWLVFEQETQIEDFKQQKVKLEVAFQMKGRSLVQAEHTELVVFFPTKVRTGLGFLIQAPFKTKVTRESLDEECDINKRLLMTAARLASERLEFLRDIGRLDSQSYTALPIAANDFPPASFCRPVFDEIRYAIKTRNLLPAHPDAPDATKFICGCQAVATCDSVLRELLTNGELKEALGGETEWRWLAGEILLEGEGALAAYLRNEIGIQQFTADDFVSWLETKDADWWKALDEKYLLSAYRYLNVQSEYKRLRKLPLVRLESGEHVSPDERAVFFPADNTHEKKELAPFLSKLPIIRLSLLDDDEDKTVEGFLRKIGVARLVASEFIKHYFVPHFKDGSKHTVDDAVALGRYLFSALPRMNGAERQTTVAQLSQINWLLCRTKAKSEANYLNAPSKVYIGSHYTGQSFLEGYFSASPDKYFVHECYHKEGEDWLSFLETLGCSPAPRKIEEGHEMDGLEAILTKLSRVEGEERLHLSKVIFDAMSATVPDGEYERRTWGTVTTRVWVTRRGPGGGDWMNRPEPARFLANLKKKAWLPQASGPLCRPEELFENTEQNRRVLGNRVCYLHENIKPTTDEEKWLARELGIQPRPTKDSILRVLRDFKSAEAKLDEVLQLYSALAQFGADISDEFEEDELIFCPDSDKRWRPPSEAFWDDESPVFGSTRGYLKKIYAGFESFFRNAGVAQSATPIDYAKALLEIANNKNASEESRGRIHHIYKLLSPRFDKGGDWREDEEWVEVWEELQTGPFWLGRKGEGFSFFSRSELTVVDNEHLAELFDGKVAFWPFKGLNDFAKDHLEIETCSTAGQKFEVANEGEQQNALSEQITTAWPSIGDFLQSDKWKGGVLDGRKPGNTPPVIKEAGKIAVIYTLKEAKEPNVKAAFFDSAKNTVWLVHNEASNSDDHFEALSEALQEHFGPEPLREFIHDLFRKGIEKIAVKWRKRGLMPRSKDPFENPPTEPDTPVGPEPLLAGSPTEKTKVEDKIQDTPSEIAPSSNLQSTPLRGTPEPEKNAGSNDKSERLEPSRERADTKRNAEQESENNTAKKPRRSAGNDSTEADQNRAPSTLSDPVIDPDRRKRGVIEHRENAPPRESVIRERSVQPNMTDVVARARAYLRGRCVDSAGAIICQCCRLEMPFKVDGVHYFEAVQCVRDLDKLYFENYLALCPNCAAMYKHARSTNDVEMRRGIVSHSEADTVACVDVPVTLAGKERKLHFGGKHWFDLKTILGPHLEKSTSVASVAGSSPASRASKLVQCPHCRSKVRANRLDKHIRDVHHQQSRPTQLGSKSLVQSRHCKNGCGRTALAGMDYCSRCM